MHSDRTITADRRIPAPAPGPFSLAARMLGGISLAVLMVGLAAPARGQGPLVTESVARRAGLTRAWFTQVAVNRATDQISHVTLNEGTLFVQTSGAVLHAIDAETGRTLWALTIGMPNHLSLAAGANSRYVAAVNGSTLYLLDRASGAVEWSRRLRGAVGAGPVLTKTRVFVPMVSGMLEGYLLQERGPQTPWIYQSFGRIFTQPVLSNAKVSWTTDKGNLYVASADPMLIRGRLQTRSTIESRPAYWTPCFFACSLDGYVYAVDEKSAQTRWRFPAGEPIREPPIALEGRVYIAPQFSGLFCLDAETGKQLWLASGVIQFVAQSKQRVYGIDKSRQLAILDAATGARLGTMPLDPSLMKLHNEHTDRLYFFSPTGLMECLHESDLEKPLVHQPPPSEESDLPGVKPKAPAKKGGEAADAEDPPAAGPADAKGDDAADAMPDEKAGKKEKPDAMKEDDPFK